MGGKRVIYADTVFEKTWMAVYPGLSVSADQLVHYDIGADCFRACNRLYGYGCSTD